MNGFFLLDIVDGDLKMMLVLIWRMIVDLQFSNLAKQNKELLGDIETDDGPRQLLLIWCRDRLKNYPNVQIDNFQDR